MLLSSIFPKQNSPTARLSVFTLIPAAGPSLSAARQTREGSEKGRPRTRGHGEEDGSEAKRGDDWGLPPFFSMSHTGPLTLEWERK